MPFLDRKCHGIEILEDVLTVDFRTQKKKEKRKIRQGASLFLCD